MTAECGLSFYYFSDERRTLLCRPFVDVANCVSAKVLSFYSDASLNKNLGMGAIFGTRWLVAAWDKNFILQENPSIEFLELFALVAAILTWGHLPQLCNTKVVIFCDNKTVKHIVNKMTSGCRQCLKLVRILMMHNLKHNRRIKVVYVKSRRNVISDALSRLDFKWFLGFSTC